MLANLLLGAASGLGRAVYTSKTNPQMAPAERFWDAALFGAGTALGTFSTLGLVGRGLSPVLAGALTTGAGTLGMLAARNTDVEPLAQGAMLGGGVGTVGTVVDPNWALGLRPRVFISHAFKHTPELLELTGGLHSSSLSWYDHSVPVYEQFDTASASRLRGLLWNQIRGTSVFALLVGRGVARRPCIRDEVSMAMVLAKPIVVIDQNPDGSSLLPPELNGYPLLERVSLGRPGAVIGSIRRLLAHRA
jgi:hypothetical protein